MHLHIIHSAGDLRADRLDRILQVDGAHVLEAQGALDGAENHAIAKRPTPSIHQAQKDSARHFDIATRAEP